MGFPVPFGALDARRMERRRARRAARSPLARARRHRSGGGRRRCCAITRAGRTDGGDRIWSLLNLELWYRTFIDGDGVQTLPHPSAPARTGDRPHR